MGRELAGLRVIFLTGLLTKADTGVLGKNIGGNRYLSKAVSDKEIFECVNYLFN